MPTMLDLFCGAGGAGMGYHRAGWTVTGVDIRPQRRYPFAFVQADALDYLQAHGHEYDAIHASPPCQAYSVTRPLTRKEHPMLVDDVRSVLRAIGRPYIIENVPGAPLHNPLMLCGSMFGLRVIRHRLFEMSHPLYFPPRACGCRLGIATSNTKRQKALTGTRAPSLADGYDWVTVAGNDYLADEGRAAMDIHWMSRNELSQAIPPAYTEFIGRHMLEVL